MSRFADTSYFLALLIPNDEYHERAVALAVVWGGPMMTTEFVLIEVGNHLSPRHSRGVFVRFVDAITREARMTLIPSSHEWFQRGLRFYEDRPDKDWSLTDCISFEVMRENAIDDALTADHHFMQAGFNVLVR